MVDYEKRLLLLLLLLSLTYLDLGFKEVDSFSLLPHWVNSTYTRSEFRFQGYSVGFLKL